MTRRDFELIAGLLREVGVVATAGVGERGWAARATWGLTVDVFADRLAATNPLFDRSRFVRACQPS